MSELVNSRDNRGAIRRKLLTGASALALTGYLSSASMAGAEENSRPVFWLEFGGQFQSLSDPSQTWVVPNLPLVIDHPVTGILGQPPRIGYDLDGRIAFQPDGSDWSFSAAIQYGKAKHGPKSAHDQTYKTHAKYGGRIVPTTYAFTDLNSVEETNHVILDFQASKDLGIGLFGGHGSSTVTFGVRMAQFHERADGAMTAATSVPSKYAKGPTLDAYMHSVRSFHGVGPSIAWNGSAPFAGSLEDGLAFDWGANAALLFGRQRTEARTHAEKDLVAGYSPTPYPHFIRSMQTHSTLASIRKKQVMVPNIGGFAGVSYRLRGEAKISFGYRADMFFGAMDGGIATREEENRAFFGPYASISVGLGD